MRKRTVIILFVLLITLLSACSANEQENKAKEGDRTDEQGKQETEEQSLNVDKGILNVDVTLPASFLKDKIWTRLLLMQKMMTSKLQKMMMVLFLIKCRKLNIKK